MHLVAPQVWAWRRRRAKPIARSVDRILCFFPFEPPLFTRFGCLARDFVGTSAALVDTVPPRAEAGDTGAFGVPPGKRLLLIAPGSREREVSQLLPLLHAAARRRWSGGMAATSVVSSVAQLPRDLCRSAPPITGWSRAAAAMLPLRRRRTSG